MEEKREDRLVYNMGKKTVGEIVKGFKGYQITLRFESGVKVMYEGSCGWYDKRVPLGYSYDKKQKSMMIHI